MMLSLENAMNKLEKIDWTYDGFEIRLTNAYLMREYFRRSALWCRVLKLKTKSPFFDVASHITDQIQIPKDYLSRLKQIRPHNDLVSNTCYWYIRWAILHDLGFVTPYELPDCYDPLIKLYERGGYAIINAGGGVDIDVGTTVTYTGWSKGKFETMKEIDISDDNLLQMDNMYHNQ